MILSLTDKTYLQSLRKFSILGNVGSGAFIIPDYDNLNLLERALGGIDLKIDNLSEDEVDFISVAYEYGLIKLDQDANEVTKGVKSAYLHVTDKCNYNCRGCYSQVDSRNDCNDLELSTICDIMDSLRHNGFQVLAVSGGEPFIREDIIEILSFARNTAQFEKIIVATNGTFITDEIATSLVGLVDEVKVAIDGYSSDNGCFIRDSGSYATSINAVKVLKKRGVNVCLLPTLHAFNYRFVREYQMLAEEYGVQLAFSILTCDPSDDEVGCYVMKNEHLSYLVGNVEPHLLSSFDDVAVDNDNLSFTQSCGAGETIISIDAKGDVYPCHMLHAESFKFGSILEQGLQDILTATSPLQSVDQRLECSHCDYRYLCGGGCQARSYMHFADTAKPDPYCETYKDQFKSFFDSIEDLIIEL